MSVRLSDQVRKEATKFSQISKVIAEIENQELMGKLWAVYSQIFTKCVPAKGRLRDFKEVLKVVSGIVIDEIMMSKE